MTFIEQFYEACSNVTHDIKVYSQGYDLAKFKLQALAHYAIVNACKYKNPTFLLFQYFVNEVSNKSFVSTHLSKHVSVLDDSQQLLRNELSRQFAHIIEQPLH